MNKTVRIWKAKGWQSYYKAYSWVTNTGYQHRTVRVLIIPSLLLILTWVAAPVLQAASVGYFQHEKHFELLRTLFLTIGGALIGATAIAFSLIMFAMQVNVERMPFGLFRKFSSDVKLMAAFVGTFFLSIAIACQSLVPNYAWASTAILASLWEMGLIVTLLLVAYRRALNLISPTQQLSILVHDTSRALNNWAKAMERARPLLEKQSTPEDEINRRDSSHDWEKFAYFQQFPNWASIAHGSVAHCIAYARRYAEQGDHEVSSIALQSILLINKAYIEAKGKTFFSQHDNPLSGDALINDTLEHMRRLVQVGIGRADEEQIEQSFKMFAGLCNVYSSIDYSTDHVTKHHMHLAAGYLAEAVESVAPHQMADVMMEGVRLIGDAAQLILLQKDPSHIVTLTEKVALIACTGAINKNYRPVTQVAVRQLAMLTFGLIRSRSHEAHFAIKEVRKNVKLVAKMCFETPDTAFPSIHSTSLAPYYSGTTTDGLMSWLTDLCNAVSDPKEDPESAGMIISNLENWASDLYQTEKELLLLAIEKKSHFTFDLINWIVHITKLLLAVSNAPVCGDHDREKLRKSAEWLISVLSWVPDNIEDVRFVEKYQVTEQLFEAAVDAKQRDCDEIAYSIRDLLLAWAFKAGKFETGWAILERACCGLVCLNIMFEFDDDVLINAIEKRLAGVDSPSLELRFRASQEIRKEAEKYHRAGYSTREIEAAMAHVDQGRLRSLLNKIADQLTPEVEGDIAVLEGGDRNGE